MPLPIRVSAGFLVIGLSGKIRIHTLPPRFISRVSATREASICRLVIHPGSMHIRPNSPKAMVFPRVALTREMKRGGKIWIRIFPDKPITKKPAETRMGTGKGNVEYYVAVVKPGRVLYEMEGMTEQVAREAFKLAQAKLPMRTRIVHRGELSI